MCVEESAELVTEIKELSFFYRRKEKKSKVLQNNCYRGMYISC